jgi:3,4-dihydroxy 2-butanone 4-phosphate synthase
MVPKNTEMMRTAYTISVDYLHGMFIKICGTCNSIVHMSDKRVLKIVLIMLIGTTTGISAHDRALTVRKLADMNTKPEDFSRPGHILPLRAVPGGTLKRFGHTEAGVDLCRLAGLAPVAVIGELLKDGDEMGEVARIKYREAHKLDGDDQL